MLRKESSLVVDSSYNWITGFDQNKKKIGKMLKEKISMLSDLYEEFKKTK